MDIIKESFKKVKKDIDSLHKEVSFLKKGLKENREKMIELCKILQYLNKTISKIPLTSCLNTPPHTSTNTPLNKTHQTDIKTDNLNFKPLKDQILDISNGNEGVSTDRQTNRQTNRQTQNTQKENPSINEASYIINSLDNLKKDLSKTFKQLTNQELTVFSTIYQLEEEMGPPNYKDLSTKLNLTESSIRDYIGRLINKGIPVEKIKINNKNIQLSISKNLKKIATLSTIIQLREGKY